MTSRTNKQLKILQYIKRVDILIERVVKKVIRIANTKESERNYIYYQFPEMAHLIEKNVRNSFTSGIPSSIIRCYAKFNIYDTKDKIINNNIVTKSYHQYNDIETWRYVVICATTY